ncbi:related to DNA mismatch repair protein MutL [Desulfotalea psychrophila LSv54]|uniref:Related to DNA mismatch repair protein MutL n=1 Tax=Desulfotalea psychrophila (strain LSv54 / DSM 12343) TaxID=177439 RepID=Q6ALS9_DESPS|nr:DNA mismatch repair protein MutL [Desulfotalea psychrophila]CAG36696.1 related to DNA mismatch repair protein MutL [Desulfotalea psychrophila LSv54]
MQAGVLAAIRAEQGHLQQNIFGEKSQVVPQLERSEPSPATHPPAIERQVQSAVVGEKSAAPMRVEPLVETAEGTEVYQRQEPAKVYQRQEPAVTESSRVEAVQIDQEPVAEQLLPREEEGRGLEILGQVDNLYIFCRSQAGLVVIDQHAAHERLLYEKLKKHFSANSMVKQNLLFPETVELSLYQSQLVEKHLEDLEKMGFSLRDFGGNSYVIGAIPALAGQIAPQKIFFDVLEQFGADGKSRKDAGDMLDSILASMACRAAIKAGARLSQREMESLLADMAAADLFSHCPHGRPVVKQFSSDEIKKWFYRT